MQGYTDMEATGSDVPSEVRLAGRGLSEEERTQQLAGAPSLLGPWRLGGVPSSPAHSSTAVQTCYLITDGCALAIAMLCVIPL